jgi:hypothetical protein
LDYLPLHPEDLLGLRPQGGLVQGAGAELVQHHAAQLLHQLVALLVQAVELGRALGALEGVVQLRPQPRCLFLELVEESHVLTSFAVVNPCPAGLP